MCGWTIAVYSFAVGTSIMGAIGEFGAGRVSSGMLNIAIAAFCAIVAVHEIKRKPPTK